VTNKSGCRDG